LPRIRPVYLACVLGMRICVAQQAPSTPAQPAAVHSETPRVTLSSLQGVPVGEVTVNSPGVEHPEWLVSLLPQKTGEPLDKYKVQRSVQVLYDTGRFSAIQVEAQRNPQGQVILTFNARENYFFGSLVVEGAPGRPAASQLVNASKLGLGEQFTDQKVSAGIDAMQHLLQENGYYKAEIQPFYEWDATNQQVKVMFVVTPGEPAHVGKLEVTGNPGFTAAQISDIAKLHPGDRVTAAHLTRAVQKLKKKYQGEDRLGAQIAITQRLYHPETNTVDYTFDIDHGPKVSVTVEGAPIHETTVKKYVPIFEEGAVDDDLINEGKRNLRDYLQTKGYFEARVDATRQQESGTDNQDVVFQVDRGRRHKLALISIQGNHYFTAEALRERMRIQAAGGFQLHGLFSQSLLAQDVGAIEDLYHANGFREARVTSDVRDSYEGKSGQLAVFLTVEEGPQSTVGKLLVQGNSSIPTSQLLDVITLREGQPYADTKIADDRTEITRTYFDNGFPDMLFEYTAAPDAVDPNKVNVTYTIHEGPQMFVDRILVSGLHFTKEFVVDREMKIRPGDSLSQEKMLDSQSGLYNMGIFNSVDMAVQNPDGAATHKNLNFQISEARRYTFNYGLGFQVQTGQPINTQNAQTTGAQAPNPQGKTGFSPQVSFGVTRLNFRGRDHTVTLQSKYGTLEKLALVGYDAPRWFDSEHLALNFTTFYEETNDVRTFTARRLEGSAEIKETVNKGTTLLYRFTYRRVSTDNLVIDPNLVPLFSQAVRVGMPEFTFIRDTRDDPINSHKGTFSTLDYGVASSAFGSEANFNRVVLQNSSYYQFHRRRWVFARSTRIGMEGLFGNTTFLPLPERFFLGGPTSHRGFAINQAGPRDLTTGFPLGGEAMLLNNLELRTPPLPLPWTGNNVSAVLFHDMGNVFSSVEDMTHNLLRFTQPDRSACLNPTGGSCSFNYLSHAVGGGIRYLTPIGPVSLDFGYNLNPPVFPIGDQNRSDTLKHFNFFFNIGQTF